MIRELAPAKVNLVLRIGPAAANGLHEVCSLFASLDLADEVEVEPATDGLGRVRGGRRPEPGRARCARSAARLLGHAAAGARSASTSGSRSRPGWPAAAPTPPRSCARRTRSHELPFDDGPAARDRRAARLGRAEPGRAGARRRDRHRRARRARRAAADGARARCRRRSGSPPPRSSARPTEMGLPRASARPERPARARGPSRSRRSPPARERPPAGHAAPAARARGA